MSSGVKGFLVGLVLGAAVAFGAAYVLSSRYKLENNGPGGLISMRVDTWTGKTWMYRYTEENAVKTWFWDPMLEGK